MESEGRNRLDVFSYVIEKNAPIYRAIVDIFADAKTRYRIQLRVEEVARELRTRAVIFGDEVDLIRHLDALHTWGNLKRTQDTREVATLAEFYRRRSLYQFTPEGEEAHRGVLAVERVLEASGGRLSSVMLPAIAERLESVRAEMDTEQPDVARLYTLLRELHTFSTELAENARRFMNDLADSLDTLALTDEAFLTYKRAVLVYLQGFVAELNRYQPRIIASIEAIDRLDANRVTALAATADESPAPDGRRRGPVRELRDRWEALRAWFCGTHHQRPEVEHLRAATRDAIGRILRVLDRLNEKRFLRINRASDLMRLARWFAVAKTPVEGDALFTAAFGLHSARHFSACCPDEDLDRGRSWWSAKPAEIPPRLRESGRRSNPGRPGAVANYSDGKRAALATIRELEERNSRAMQRFVDCRLRLSELGRLPRAEFDAILALLEAALSSPAQSDGRRRGTVLGQYAVMLTPPMEGTQAVIETEDGRFTAPDFALEVDARAESALLRGAL